MKPEGLGLGAQSNQNNLAAHDQAIRTAERTRILKLLEGRLAQSPFEHPEETIEGIDQMLMDIMLGHK